MNGGQSGSRCELNHLYFRIAVILPECEILARSAFPDIDHNATFPSLCDSRREDLVEDARTDSRTPGKRSSRSSLRKRLRRAVPSLRVAINPDARRTRK